MDEDKIALAAEIEVMKAAGIRYGEEALEAHGKLDSIRKLVIAEEEKLNGVMKGRAKAEADIEKFLAEMKFLKEKNKKDMDTAEEDMEKALKREESALASIAERKESLQAINDGIIVEKDRLTMLVKEREAYLDNIETRRGNAEGVLKELLGMKEKEFETIVSLKRDKPIIT